MLDLIPAIYQFFYPLKIPIPVILFDQAPIGVLTRRHMNTGVWFRENQLLFFSPSNFASAQVFNNQQKSENTSRVTSD